MLRVATQLTNCSAIALVALCLSHCDTPQSDVVIENRYAPSQQLVLYRAFWQAVSFPNPILPGLSSSPQATVVASENTAYVVLAQGWDPTTAKAPTSFVVLRSRAGFAVGLNRTLNIPVDDTTFIGNCAAGSVLSQDQADFITQRVFASDFADLTYNAATCATSAGPPR